MKNSKILKGIISIITMVLIICLSTNVYADDDILDLDNTIIGGNSTTGNNTTGNNTTGNNTSGNSTSGNNTTTNQASGNSSTYEESDIPYAGTADTMLMVSAFIVCGIIGVYTFIKLSDYSNI